MEEKIKNEWNGMCFNPLSQDKMNQILDGRRRTALQHLARRSRRFAILAAVSILWSIMFVFGDIFDESYRLPLVAAFSVYFLTCTVMDTYLYQRIKAIDCSVMSVREVAMEAMACRKRHLQFVVILLPMAIGLIYLLMNALQFDKYAVMGLCIGGCIGLAIGSYNLMKFMADYKMLKQE